MASKSDYLEAAELNRELRGVALAPTATVYFALFTVAPSDSGGGTEVTGGAYARVGVTANATNFTDPAATGESSNANPITFPTPTADWGNVVAVATFDALTGGNMLRWATMVTPRSVTTGNPFTIPAGSAIFRNT